MNSASSQLVGLNAAAKLDDDPDQSDEEYSAYAQRLWHERVWNAALAILFANEEPFNRLVQALHEKEKVKGARLRHVLAQVRRVAS